MRLVVFNITVFRVQGPLIIGTADMWCDLNNIMIAYADDSTLYAIIKSPSDLAVADSLNLDLSKIQSWCSSWSMNLNSRKSTTMNAPHPILIIIRHSLAMDDSFKLLGVLFNENLTFEKCYRNPGFRDLWQYAV